MLFPTASLVIHLYRTISLLFFGCMTDRSTRHGVTRGTMAGKKKTLKRKLVRLQAEQNSHKRRRALSQQMAGEQSERWKNKLQKSSLHLSWVQREGKRKAGRVGCNGSKKQSFFDNMCSRTIPWFSFPTLDSSDQYVPPTKKTSALCHCVVLKFHS